MGVYVDIMMCFGFKIDSRLAMEVLRQEIPKHYPEAATNDADDVWTDDEFLEHADTLPLPLDFVIVCGVPNPEAEIIERPFYLGLSFDKIELSSMRELLDITNHPDFAKLVELAVQLGTSDTQPAIHTFALVDY